MTQAKLTLDPKPLLDYLEEEWFWEPESGLAGIADTGPQIVAELVHAAQSAGAIRGPDGVGLVAYSVGDGMVLVQLELIESYWRVSRYSVDHREFINADGHDPETVIELVLAHANELLAELPAELAAGFGAQ